MSLTHKQNFRIVLYSPLFSVQYCSLFGIAKTKQTTVIINSAMSSSYVTFWNYQNLYQNSMEAIIPRDSAKGNTQFIIRKWLLIYSCVFVLVFALASSLYILQERNRLHFRQKRLFRSIWLIRTKKKTTHPPTKTRSNPRMDCVYINETSPIKIFTIRWKSR